MMQKSNCGSKLSLLPQFFIWEGKNMAYPGRQNIYEATIRRMVREALTQQEQEFRQQHETDTDAQLLAYLRAWAIRKHHTPWPGEIVGGSFIQERFGSWDRALAMARLPMPKTANRSQSFVRVQEETQKQKEIYRQRKAEKKTLAQERLAQQAAKKKE